MTRRSSGKTPLQGMYFDIWDPDFYTAVTKLGFVTQGCLHSFQYTLAIFSAKNVGKLTLNRKII
ncbi:hypothetical protein Poly51_20820 [Rubripirellula tenax]|uniref:Uncharacterized protein n=1 Tax=Rubripirellula tenax TaxID=2528015 RepID=A0A5C6FGI7_9BACT|nr:hypothetical protein Poly51_20820 [Rubripirellula tenax]